MNNKNIALLGGTFDPVHYGHLKIAEQVTHKLNFAEVKFIPNNIPPHKNTTVANTEQRLAMLNLAIAGSAKFNLELCEINRDGKSYMIDTVHYLKTQAEYINATLWLILGLDAFYSLPQWHHWQELITSCNFIVINREPAPSRPDWIAEYLPQNFLKERMVFLDIEPIKISATNIRHLFKNYSENQQAIRQMLLDQSLSIF